MPTRLISLVATVAAAALAACGSSASARPDAEARLMLDFQPNAVHAGIFLAEARGFTDAEGVDLRVETPGVSCAICSSETAWPRLVMGAVNTSRGRSGMGGK